jgi:hypothetical protein
MLIYSKEKYNCAHHAIRRINERLGCNIHWSEGDEWQVEFVRNLRKNFKPIPTPHENCLVVMTCYLGEFHLGIYRNYMVEHNYVDSVILSDIGTINEEFKRVRYYEYKHQAV